MGDPARHDVAVLKGFCDICVDGVVPQQHQPVAHKGGGKAKQAPQGPADPETAALAARVKAFQKGSPEQKEMWYSFCGAVKDPNRHDAASLEEFCQLYGVPVDSQGS